MGTKLPQKGAQPPQFSAHVYCGQTAAYIRIPLDTEVGLRLCDIVLDGDSAAPLLKGHSPQFSAHVRCGQTAGWTKIPLGMEVGLGPGHIVLDGDAAPPAKGAQQPPPPLFGRCLLWPWSPMSATAELLYLLYYVSIHIATSCCGSDASCGILRH